MFEYWNSPNGMDSISSTQVDFAQKKNQRDLQERKRLIEPKIISTYNRYLHSMYLMLAILSKFHQNRQRRSRDQLRFAQINIYLYCLLFCHLL